MLRWRRRGIAELWSQLLDNCFLSPAGSSKTDTYDALKQYITQGGHVDNVCSQVDSECASFWNFH